MNWVFLYLASSLASFLGYLIASNIIMRKKRRPTGNLMLTIGKGGHTAEMLYMSQRYDFKKFNKVYLIIGDDDDLSKDKAIHFWKENKCGIKRQLYRWHFEHRISELSV